MEDSTSVSTDEPSTVALTTVATLHSTETEAWTSETTSNVRTTHVFTTETITATTVQTTDTDTTTKTKVTIFTTDVTSEASTSTIHFNTTTVEDMSTGCNCSEFCPAWYNNNNKSYIHYNDTEKLLERLRQINDFLRIDKKSLSSTIRTKISAPDERPSAANIGYFGIVVIISSILIIVACDAATLLQIFDISRQHKRIDSV